jgi:hypothetical protein
MTDTEEGTSHEPLPQVLQDAIDTYLQWAKRQWPQEKEEPQIIKPLYHYTDEHGLKGIIASETIGFTDYRHLNDPSELTHGIKITGDVIRLAGTGVDASAQSFLKHLNDAFASATSFANAEYLIACFSYDGNDLGQWRAYADNGRGYAIGFAPELFWRDTHHMPLHGAVVASVRYDTNEITARHRLAVEEAVRIFLETVNANADLVRDWAIAISFMRGLAKAVVAWPPMMWNCLTWKHHAYENEKEVRLFILQSRDGFMPDDIKTRLRGRSEIVPYIAHPMPIRKHIVQIVVGPAAPPDAERSVRTMLNSLGVDPSIPVDRSDIPYRAL